MSPPSTPFFAASERGGSRRGGAMPELWVPGAAEPSLEAFVERVRRRIERYASQHGAEQTLVEVELADGGHYPLRALDAEPGFGFLTLCLHPAEDDPEELIVPIAAIRRIELRPSDEGPGKLGFSLPGQ